MNEKTVNTIWGLAGISLIILMFGSMYMMRGDMHSVFPKIQANTRSLIKFNENYKNHVHERHMKDKAILPKEIITHENGEQTIYY